METFAIVTYCASDGARKILKIVDNIQTLVVIAQIMTTIIMASCLCSIINRLSLLFARLLLSKIF
ncbi:MAG: hypothetical protein US49_C0006G0017 [candidate division TM6 bacterium GW2011_GWF2_37_49]|nr:MAG: hypothetical protein US49_C0006G0017 [candidate division TM6 bacterium GW2011_GWF2_37_49]